MKRKSREKCKHGIPRSAEYCDRCEEGGNPDGSFKPGTVAR